LVVFAVGWGVTVPHGIYHVDLTLDNESTISGQWITRSGDDILLQIEGKIVAVRASKVVRRDFHSEDGYASATCAAGDAPFQPTAERFANLRCRAHIHDVIFVIILHQHISMKTWLNRHGLCTCLTGDT